MLRFITIILPIEEGSKRFGPGYFLGNGLGCVQFCKICRFLHNRR